MTDAVVSNAYHRVIMNKPKLQKARSLYFSFDLSTGSSWPLEKQPRHSQQLFLI